MASDGRDSNERWRAVQEGKIMPYIKQGDRYVLEDAIINLSDLITDPGQLNYVITRLCLRENPERYVEYMALVGTLECVKLEFYRKAAAIYEDKKEKENGAVYPGEHGYVS